MTILPSPPPADHACGLGCEEGTGLSDSSSRANGLTSRDCSDRGARWALKQHQCTHRQFMARSLRPGEALRKNPVRAPAPPFDPGVASTPWSSWLVAGHITPISVTSPHAIFLLYISLHGAVLSVWVSLLCLQPAWLNILHILG